MPQLSATERTVKYATTTSDLGAAWVFVMEKMDLVGPAPTICISPVWFFDELEGFDNRQQVFEVTVEGMVEESITEV